MLRPSLEEFESCSRRGNLIPVAREILADLDTPLSLFRRLDDGRTSFLLESVEGGEKWARYSFLGTGARATFTAYGRKITWVEHRGGQQQTEEATAEGDPLEFLRDKLRALHHVTPDGVEWPRFIGGAVGMIGYDWVRFVEQLPDPNPDEVGLPDLSFVLPETVVVYDNIKHTALIVRHVHLQPGDDASARYAEAGRAIDETVALLRAPLAVEPARQPVREPMEVELSMSQGAYQ